MVVMTMKMATDENKKDSSHWHTIRGWIGQSNYKTINEEVTQVNRPHTAVT